MATHFAQEFARIFSTTGCSIAGYDWNQNHYFDPNSDCYAAETALMSELTSEAYNHSKHKKIYCLIFLLILTLITITVPTLARFKNRTAIDVDTVWDGSTATSYRNGTGTETNPYIISNGSELAYFASELATNNYENTYFQLNTIIIVKKQVPK